MQQNHLEGFLKHRFLDLTQRVSNLVGLELGPKMRISSKFPADPNAAGVWTIV